ncbi:MAG: FtsX-like permease family protein [Flavitalea sp.]
MLSGYLKIGLRNLRKYRSFTIINVIGLTISVTFCILLYLNIRYEQSFDKFHVSGDRLFRLEQTNLWKATEEKKAKFLSFINEQEEVKNTLVFPGKVFGDLERTFPEIKAAVPMSGEWNMFVIANGRQFKEEKALDVGSAFLESLSFKMIAGIKETALKGKQNVVLSESIARKYFGTTNVMGKTLLLPDRDSMLMTITGVIEDVPGNSSIKFNILLPIEIGTDLQENLEGGFNQSRYQIIIHLKENIDAVKFETKLNEWVKGYFVEPYLSKVGFFEPDLVAQMHWYLRPLADAHYNVSTFWGHYTNAKNLYQLACLVLIILALASINYVLLTVSNAAKRSKEVGMRKILGANNKSVIYQFWVETQMVVLVAVIAGFFIAWALLPVYGKLTDTPISLSAFPLSEILLAIVALAFVLGLIAGYYPAFILSRMKPASIVKSSTTFKINPGFSRVMMVAQYTACIILMVAAYVITSQMNFINNKDLGFDKEQILMVKNQGFDRDRTKKINERFEGWYPNESFIKNYTTMNAGLSGGGNTNGFKLNGEQKWLRQLAVGYDYFTMLNLKFVEGRPFNANFKGDTSSTERPSIVNETLFKMLGKEAKVGVYNKDIRSTIIGVVKDYHFESLTKKIEPQQHTLITWYNQYFLFKVQAGKMPDAIDKIGTVYHQAVGDLPYEYTFMDEDIAHMYEADKRWQRLVQAGCIFAILIACMGLFGLSAINAANRVKEIGIRKVLGASVPDVVISLSRNFVGMILIAFLIAAPVAWWLMSSWLQDFEYRIDISLWMLVVVGLVAFLIAMCTLGYQAVRAAIANPVESLKAE